MKRWIRASIAAVVTVATLVITAAIAVTPGPSMLHDGEAPLADLTGNTVSAKDLELESTLHGVYLGGGTHSDDQQGTASRPGDSRFTNIPAVRQFLTRIFDDSSAHTVSSSARTVSAAQRSRSANTQVSGKAAGQASGSGTTGTTGSTGAKGTTAGTSSAGTGSTGAAAKPAVGGSTGANNKSTNSSTDPKSVDGAKIDSLKLSWVDTTDPTYKVDTTSDAKLSFRGRVDFQISGTREHQPGEVTFTLPIDLFAGRDKSAVGSIEMSVPQDGTSSDATFTYQRVGNNIVVRNAQTISGAYQGFFEFAYTQITPHLIVSNKASNPITVTLKDVGNNDEEATATSTPIDAVVTTHETLNNAKKEGKVYETMPSSANKVPSGFDQSKYWYVDWYGYANVSGNQSFKIAVKDTPNSSDHGIIIGTDIPGAQVSSDGSSLSADDAFTGYTAYQGNNFFYHVIMAYPLSEVKTKAAAAQDSGQGSGTAGSSASSAPGTAGSTTSGTTTGSTDSSTSSTTGTGVYASKTVTNTLTYTLTPLDDKVAQDKPATKSVEYAIRPFVVTGKQMQLCKTGPSDAPSLYVPTYCNLAPSNDSKNQYGLNTLSQKQPFTTDWLVEGRQFVEAETSSATADQTNPSNFGKFPVDTEITDGQEWFGDSYADKDASLTSADLTVNSLRLRVPTMYSFTGTPVSGYDYVKNTSITAPKATISMMKDDTWLTAGVATYTNRTVSIAANTDNGASASGSTLYFPSGVTQWKVTYSSKDSSDMANTAGEAWAAVANVTLKPTDKVLERVTAIMNASTQGYGYLVNNARMRLTFHRDNEVSYSDEWNQNYSQALASAAQWASMDKTGEQKSRDANRQLLTVHYALEQNLRTNIEDRLVAKQVMGNGTLPSDTSGRFYDLLPRGMEVVTSTISTSGGDVSSVQVVDDWKGTGRQMLIVGVQGQRSWEHEYYSDQDNYFRRIEFDANYTYSDAKSYGDNPVNNAVYVSDSPTLGTQKGSQSEPDDPSAGKNTESAAAVQGAPTTGTGSAAKSVLAALEPSNAGKVSTLYARAQTKVEPLQSSFGQVSKDVSVQGSGVWTTGRDKKTDDKTKVVTVDPKLSVTVEDGGVYRYRLRATAQGDKTMSGIVLADNIEALTPSATDKDQAADAGTAQWKGTLVSVDTSALTAKGIKPVVYYRTSTFDTSAAVNLKDGTWTDTKPSDMTTVKAVAIDASTAKDGSDYVLPKNDSLWAQLVMRAPTGQTAADAAKKSAKAFNDVYLASSTDGESHWLPSAYTKVGLKPYNITVTKKWDDDGDRDAKRPKSVEMHLLANGKDTCATDSTQTCQKATLSADNNWTATFENLPKSDKDGNTIVYSATDSVDGYTATTTQKETATDSAFLLDITLTNTHKPETTSISGTKTWKGGAPPTSLTLDLYDCTDPQNCTDTGRTTTVQNNGTSTWTWNFTDLPKNRNVDGKAVPIVYKVREEKSAGWMPQSVTNGTEQNMADTAGKAYQHAYQSGETIINKWHPYGSLALTKTVICGSRVAGTADQNCTVSKLDGKDFTFTLSLTKSDSSTDYDTATYKWTKSGGVCSTNPSDASCSGTIGNGRQVSLKAGQTITITNVPMGEKYSWTESDVKGFYCDLADSSGTVEDNETTLATATNVYSSTGSVDIAARKTLEGRALGLYQFGFTLSPVTGSTNGVGGKVGDPIRTAWNTKDGSVAFPALAYSQKDADKVFWYEMREKAYNHPGYTTDTTVYRVKVEVNDNGDGTQTPTVTYYKYTAGTGGTAGTLTPIDTTDKTDTTDTTATTGKSKTVPTFANKYEAKGSLSLSATKVFIGGDLTKNHFTFELLKDGTKVSTASTNDAGIATFPLLTYTQDDAGKTYTYTVREVKGGDSAIIWDSHTETTTVKVADNGDGTLSLDQTFSATSGSDSGTTSGSGSGTTSGSSSAIPLVWHNQAGNGSLRISKLLTDDAATQAKKDTQFPMRVRLSPPQGDTQLEKLAEEKKPLMTGTIHARADGKTEASDTAGSWEIHKDDTGYYIDITVQGGGWVRIDGIPGGTGYLVTEEGRK